MTPKPFYNRDGIRIYCGNALELLPMLAQEKVSFVYSDPPYGLDVVKVSGVLPGRPNGNGYTAERSGTLRSDTAQPFGGKKRQGEPRVRPENNMAYPAGSLTRSEPTVPVGSGKPFGSKSPNPTVPVGFGEAGKNKLIDCGYYAPIAGDDTTQTAILSSTLCLSQWPKAVQVWWGGNYYANALPPSSCWIVWDKMNTGNFADCELAWTNQRTAVRQFRHMWNGLLKASERGEARIHPTQKPILLADFCYRKYGKPGDLILDPFAGSGSAAVAAKRLNRAYVGIEISEDYCCKIIDRLERETYSMDFAADTEREPDTEPAQGAMEL